MATLCFAWRWWVPPQGSTIVQAGRDWHALWYVNSPRPQDDNCQRWSVLTCNVKCQYPLPPRIDMHCEMWNVNTRPSPRIDNCQSWSGLTCTDMAACTYFSKEIRIHFLYQLDGKADFGQRFSVFKVQVHHYMSLVHAHSDITTTWTSLLLNHQRGRTLGQPHNSTFAIQCNHATWRDHRSVVTGSRHCSIPIFLAVLLEKSDCRSFCRLGFCST